MSDVNIVANDKSVFDAFYLRESFASTSYLKKPSSISHNVAMFWHGQCVTNTELRGEKCLFFLQRMPFYYFEK